MKETEEITINPSKQYTKPTVKSGVWLATYKDETVGMNWFKHCGPGKINATRVALLAVQGFTMVQGKLPGYLCLYGTALATGDTQGLHECTQFIQHDMAIGPENYVTPEDNIPAVIGHEQGMRLGTSDTMSSQIGMHSPIDGMDSTAYAIAKTCAEMKIDFRCFKYFTKNYPYSGNHDAWLADCKKGATLMKQMCEERFEDAPSLMAGAEGHTTHSAGMGR